MPFGEGYSCCQRCQTLVADCPPAQRDPRVTNDAADYYGQQYWFGHQTGDLSLPDIVSRSRTDLSERCIHWLRSVLQYKIPPAKILEIGSAHGGFVAMLRQAGFDASGLELSPSIVQFAIENFHVPMMTGPVEDQSIPQSSLDAIVMLDVMEHLPNPQETFARCLAVLKPDGLIFAQTPCYPEHKSLEELQSSKHQFPRMFDRNEHLFLFSEQSVKTLFSRLGAEYLEFIPAIFSFYDMTFVVSRQPLIPVTKELQEKSLSQTVNGRFIQALLDLDQRRLNLLAKYRQLRDMQPPTS